MAFTPRAAASSAACRLERLQPNPATGGSPARSASPTAPACPHRAKRAPFSFARHRASSRGCCGPKVPRGISDAFIVGEDFIDGDSCTLILGDNIFGGYDMEHLMNEAAEDEENATIFTRWVPDPKMFGVAEFDDEGRVISIEEKPEEPKSEYAIVGLYFLPGDAPGKAKTLKPSKRGELEITDLNRLYLDEGRLRMKKIDARTRWIDAGTFDSLLEASLYVSDMEKKNGEKILCPEIEALKKGFVTKAQMQEWISRNKCNDYFKDVVRFMKR